MSFDLYKAEQHPPNVESLEFVESMQQLIKEAMPTILGKAEHKDEEDMSMEDEYVEEVCHPIEGDGGPEMFSLPKFIPP